MSLRLSVRVRSHAIVQRGVALILAVAFAPALANAQSPAPASTTAPAPPPAAAPASTPVTAGWQNGFFIQSANGDNRLQVGALRALQGHRCPANPLEPRSAEPAARGAREPANLLLRLLLHRLSLFGLERGDDLLLLMLRHLVVVRKLHVIRAASAGH